MWVGKLNLRAGNHLVAVEYDSEKTADALRTRCAQWLTDDERDIAPAFGVRVAKVGFRRKSVGVLHHGAPIRARLASVDAAIEVLVGFVAEMTQVEEVARERTGRVTIDARAFTRSGKLVLLHAPRTRDIDERSLAAQGIEEIQTWRPLIDPASGSVTIGERSWPLDGVVMVGHGELGLDDARRHVWGLASPSEVAWAEQIDALGDRIRATAVDAVDALDQALS